MTSEVRVLNPRSGQLEILSPPDSRGISASIAASETQPAIVVPLGSPMVKPGAAWSYYNYTDSKTGKPGRVTRFWPTTGGPATATFHVLNGKLLAGTVFSWTRTGTGYDANQAVTTVYMPKGTSCGTATVLAQRTVTAVPCNYKTGNCPPPQTALRETIRKGLYALAMVTSMPALAQGSCAGEWAKYLASPALLMGTVGAAEVDWWAIGGSTMLFGDALYELEACEEGGETGPSPFRPGGGGGAKPNPSGPGGDCASGGLCMQIYTE